MVRTEDPLLEGPVAPAEGTVVNTVDQISPADPTTPPTPRSLTLRPVGPETVQGGQARRDPVGLSTRSRSVRQDPVELGSLEAGSGQSRAARPD